MAELPGAALDVAGAYTARNSRSFLDGLLMSFWQC